ncbi:Dexamethasone-induced Ras-related protein [Apis cerana cerana]|uniref:Dexamethasone-induced Ras-related protein n=1 Tax=Apis cerana cerana TaxID=94128 RepID=A0A2A3EQC3_APICC|nr:Dexamethasone-induced Ras-related protein [Apis cerana cerana]
MSPKHDQKWSNALNVPVGSSLGRGLDGEKYRKTIPRSDLDSSLASTKYLKDTRERLSTSYLKYKILSLKIPAQMMKGRHQFRRRFSLQPSSLKEGQEDGTTKNVRNERLSESDSGGGKHAESSIRHKIVVMGAAKVGKSAIINQFLYNTFTPKYKRTVEEMHHGDFNVSGIQLTLDILDTSGSYEFPAMRDLSIKSADAFILVYDVHDANTFLEVKTLRAQILNTKGAVPIVVVGNKVDLIDTEKQHKRVGDDEMGERFRGGVSERELEHFTGVQGAFDPGQAEVQSKPGIETSPQAIIATAPAFEFPQQQRSRTVPGAAAASAADP